MKKGEADPVLTFFLALIVLLVVFIFVEGEREKDRELQLKLNSIKVIGDDPNET